MKKECSFWRKAVLCTSLFFISIFHMLLPSDGAKAYYYADTEQIGGWAGYRNADGTYTITGCTALDQYDNHVLEIPATFNGRPVTGVNGDCNVVGCDDAFCDHDRKFDIFSPELVRELIFPDSVQTMDTMGEDYYDGFKFEGFVNLKKIRLPNSDYHGLYFSLDTFPQLQEISMRDMAIGSSTSLTKIHFYEGATKIDGGEYPNLTEIDLPSTVQSFSWSDSPNLTTLNCTKDLSQINIWQLLDCPNLHIAVTTGDIAYFDNCGITELTISKTYASEDDYIYSWGVEWPDISCCESLKAVHVEGATDRFYTEDGILYTERYGNGLRRSKILAIYPPAKSSATDYTLPKDIDGFDGNAFDSCKFTSITVPEDISPYFRWVCVNEGSFCDAAFKIRVIKGSAAYHYDDTKASLAKRICGFYDAHAQKISSRIEFYTGNTYTITYNLNGGTNAAGNPTSYRAGDDYITLKDPVREGYTFLGWKRNDIPNDYENTTARSSDGYFQDYTFTAIWQKGASQAQLLGTVLKNVLGGNYTISGNGTEVQYTKPSKANAKSVTIPNTIQANGTTYKVTSIAPGAFKNNKYVTNVKIGSNVATVGANAFSGCKKLKKVALGSGLTSINAKAFYKCTSLTKITIPGSVEKIGKQAFSTCPKLKSIVIKSTKLTSKSVGSKAFSKIYKKVTVKVPKKTLKAYKKLLRKKGLSSSAKIKK